MFSQMLFHLVKKTEILFYSVSFCPPKSVTNSFNFAHSTFLAHCCRELEMGRRQFHTGEESQGGNFGNERTATEKRSPIGPYFQLKLPNNFSVNCSVVDSSHCT